MKRCMQSDSTSVYCNCLKKISTMKFNPTKKKHLLLAGLALAASHGAMASGINKEQARPNILFFAVDDLRPSLGCFDDPLAITPNIDKLASEGVLFSRHYVQAPSSGPSRTSMLTGLRPDQVKVTNHATNFRDTRPDVTTLPQSFIQKGYQAISLGKMFHYSDGYNDSDSWHKEYFLKGAGFAYAIPENRRARGKGMATEAADVEDTAYLDGLISEKAIEYLHHFKENDLPFFLGVGYLKPHLPFNAPKKYWDMYQREDFRHIDDRERPVDAPDIAFHNWQELRGYWDTPEEGPFTPELEMLLRHGYYACVSFIDAQVGKVMETLEELGLKENTIIVFWGDHGFHLGEQNLWCKSTNFEMSAHAPLIISAPGMQQRGQTTDAIVQSLDIYPTLIELAGITAGQELAGTSLKPLLQDQQAPWSHLAYNQFARPYRAAIGAREPVSHMGYSVRTENWRYTAWYNVNTNQFEHPELYAMDLDGPTVNLAGKPEHADILKELHILIKAYKNNK